MKLLDLDITWLRESPDRFGMGLVFECPVHQGKNCYHKVWFANPIDGKAPFDTLNLWQRSGSAFESLTLDQLIEAVSEDGTLCWEGHIANGELV